MRVHDVTLVKKDGSGYVKYKGLTEEQWEAIVFFEHAGEVLVLSHKVYEE